MFKRKTKSTVAVTKPVSQVLSDVSGKITFPIASVLAYDDTTVYLKGMNGGVLDAKVSETTIILIQNFTQFHQ